MKFLNQLCLITLFSFLGELCRYLIPYPIPASIYGMVLMAGALALKVVHPEDVHDAGSFLTSFLPVLFVVPLVNLMDCWDQLKDNIIPIAIIVVLSTVVVFGVSGLVTQLLMHKKEEKEAAEHA